MQSLAYILDRRTIKRAVVHLIPALILGVYLAGQYDSILMRISMFVIPLCGMVIALGRGHDEVIATVSALADYRDRTESLSIPGRAAESA